MSMFTLLTKPRFGWTQVEESVLNKEEMYNFLFNVTSKYC